MTELALHAAAASRRAWPRLGGTEDLAALAPRFVRSLGDEFDLAALAGRLCPVLFEDGSTAVFALPEYAAGDQADEIERLLRRRGYRLAEPARYVTPSALLLSVARGQLPRGGSRMASAGAARADRSALAAMFTEFVRWGLHAGASDLHINVDERSDRSQVRYTIHGDYVAPGCFAGIAAATLREVLAVAWMEVRGGNGAVFDARMEQQGRIAMHLDGTPLMLRWASLAADAGPSVCLRILRLDAQGERASLQGLGYLPSQVAALERARNREGGAVVLAGIVGSGKSTTLATLMRGIDARRKVVTLEDPVEYLIENALQNTVGRALESGEAAPFDAKLRTIKRSAMNDLLIGEVRDRETGRAFMDLAGSGMNVYTTTHTGSALMIPERLASDFIGVSRDFLATPGVLKLLAYQALLPRLCAHCALPLSEASSGWRAWAEAVGRGYGVDPDALRMRNPQGCEACGNALQASRDTLRGCAGRTVVAEMIDPEGDGAMLDCVRRGDNPALARYLAARPHSAADDADMRGKTVAWCALYKALRGEIDAREMARRFGLCAAAMPVSAASGEGAR